MKKTLEETIAAVDNRIQKELQFVNEENERIRSSKLSKAYTWLYKIIPKRSYHVENGLYLRGIAIVLLRSKIIKAVYEHGLEADDCLSGNALEYILPSQDCKARLHKADAAVLPSSGCAADCKWVLIAYLWIMRLSETRVILQGDVWKKARQYFLNSIQGEEHKYLEFFDSESNYASLVDKYDLFKDELYATEAPPKTIEDLSYAMEDGFTRLETHVTEEGRFYSDEIRKNATKNSDETWKKTHKSFTALERKMDNMIDAEKKIAENQEIIWNGQMISEEESAHDDKVLRDSLAKMEARFGDEVLVRITDKQKAAENIPLYDPVYVIQKGKISYVFSELFKISPFPTTLLNKYLRVIKDGTKNELELINPKTIKKYKDNARRQYN